MRKRGFDIFWALVLGGIFLLPGLVIALSIRLETPGGALFWSERIGRCNRPFLMPKFRTMRAETPLVPTAELGNPATWITLSGKILRRTSLDELPQLWCVLRGTMSLVGPRPLLPSEIEILTERAERNINQLTPGITGWAQVNGRDSLSDQDKIRFDEDYLQRHSFGFDLKILFQTLRAIILGKGIAH